jgi:hypothetical protein
MQLKEKAIPNWDTAIKNVPLSVSLTGERFLNLLRIISAVLKYFIPNPAGKMGAHKNKKPRFEPGLLFF